MERRTFLESAAAAAVASAFGLPRSASAQQPTIIKPKRLSAGDTVALVAPATATFQTVDLAIARESLEALGLKVKFGGHLLDRHGYLAGKDKDRAADINAFFDDLSIRAVLPIRGGWGSSRLLPHLDYELIRRNPKIVLGFSDITALLLAIHAKTGLVTFHGANGMGRWDSWSVDILKRVLFDGQPVTMENKRELSDRNSLTQIDYRVQTITPGTARGRILGGNLTVLTTILGSPYLPDWNGAILFCEDTLTLEEIFNDHIKPLGVPAWQGAMIGHQTPQFTIPEGVQVEIDATAGTITMLEAAVL
jgi:muramoyltetrapeptide carboxypeptidase